jgi:hypothetical protein
MEEDEIAGSLTKLRCNLCDKMQAPSESTGKAHASHRQPQTNLLPLKSISREPLTTHGIWTLDTNPSYDNVLIHRNSSNRDSFSLKLCLINLLCTHPITPHPTPKQRLLVPPRKLRPIIRNPIVTPKPLPNQLIILCAFPRTPQTQIHPEHILWPYAFRLNAQIAFRIFEIYVWMFADRGKTPAAAKSIGHDGGWEVGVGIVVVGL